MLYPNLLNYCPPVRYVLKKKSTSQSFPQVSFAEILNCEQQVLGKIIGEGFKIYSFWQGFFQARNKLGKALAPNVLSFQGWYLRNGSFQWRSTGCIFRHNRFSANMLPLLIVQFCIA